MKFTLTLLSSCVVITVLGGATLNSEEIDLGDDGSDSECFKGSCDLVKENAKATNGDCWDLLLSGETTSGIYEIAPLSLGGVQTISVYCDMETEGGGWTVFQRREADFQPRIDFFREWSEYKSGFGLLDEEFWLGLDNLNAITSSGDYYLRVELADFDNERRFAEHQFFTVAPEDELYRLDIGNFTVGSAGDAMKTNNGMPFSTFDRDNDFSSYSCADYTHAGWWYNACTYANLNGYPWERDYGGAFIGIWWWWWRGISYSMKTTEMKFRPISALTPFV